MVAFKSLIPPAILAISAFASPLVARSSDVDEGLMMLVRSVSFEYAEQQFLLKRIDEQTKQDIEKCKNAEANMQNCKNMKGPWAATGCIQGSVKGSKVCEKPAVQEVFKQKGCENMRKPGHEKELKKFGKKAGCL